MFKSLLSAFALATVLINPALALDKPKGQVILTVSGAISETNDGGSAVFDLAMLEALEGRKATMETPWTTGKVEFSGPYLRSILKAVGANGKHIIVRALNDYSAKVPMADTAIDTILAGRMFGKEMVVRDKGPLMVVYPFDEDPSLYNEKYFSRSVWQVNKIEVVE